MPIKPFTRLTIICAFSAVLAACSDQSGRLRFLADAGRRGAEQLAAKRALADAAHDRRIFDNDVPYARAASPFALGERYVVHADALGWSVLDRHTGESARLGPKVQAGLTYAQATRAAEVLQTQDHQTWR